MADTIVKPSYLVEIEDLGFKYEEIAQYDISELSYEKRVQARDFTSVKHYAPKEEVARYVVQMTHSAFPPIVLTKDGWIVDGNTRVGARIERKEKFSPAIVLDVVYEKVADDVRERLFALAVTLNGQNGRNLTMKERRRAIEHLINLGWNNTQIEKRAGVRVTEINKMRKVLTARARLQELGVSVNGNLSTAAVAVLGDEKILLLNDEPYKALAELTADAGLNAKEVRTIGGEALALGNDDEKLKKVADVRGEFAAQIEAVKFQHGAKPPIARQLRQHLGFVNKYEDDIEALVESNGEYVEAHVACVEKSVEILGRLLLAMKA